MPAKAQKAPHMCFDKILPGQQRRAHNYISLAGHQRAIAVSGKRWVNGSKITIAFLGGSDTDQELVKKHAVEWLNYANLQFEFVDSLPAQIRISFDPNDGAWSYVGTDNLSIPMPNATMNFAWLDREVILHEFGHMIGLSHEHQNPDGGIIWDEAQVIAALSGPPNFWDEATIRHNVLNKYNATQINGTSFDPDSIMLYAFPGNWTTNRPEGTQANSDLSDTDKAFIASAKMYPGKANPGSEGAPIPLDVLPVFQSEISKPGEADIFSFTVETKGNYIVETTGATDVMVSVFGPDDPAVLIAEDDDSGSGTNARLKLDLNPGEYTVKVRAFDEDMQGKYSIHILDAGS